MRCSWAKSKEAIKYHDDQWCKETHDEIMLFKMLVLEGMQAGSSWDTILKKKKLIIRHLMILIITRLPFILKKK